jgi:hypothetical protein
VDCAEIIRRVRESKTGLMFDDKRADLSNQDIELATAIDRFNFAVVITKKNGLLTASPIYS